MLEGNQTLKDFVLNLQLHAEEEGTEPDSQDTDDNHAGESQTDGENPSAGQEEEFEVVYNKETRKIKKSEAPSYIQKGMNYDKVKSRADQAEADKAVMETHLQRAAKIQGFDTVEDYLKAVDKKEQEAENKKYEDAGIYDSSVIKEQVKKEVDNHPAVQQAKKLTEQQTVVAEANELAAQFKEMFGREITSDDITDEVLALKHQKGYALADAFFLHNKSRLKDMIEAEKSKAAEKALADHERQSKRGVESSDAPPKTNVKLDLTAEEKVWAERRVKQGLYKNLAEAADWLRGKRKPGN